MKQVEGFGKSPYNYVYNWYKNQMEIVKAERENEKKASAPSKET